MWNVPLTWAARLVGIIGVPGASARTSPSFAATSAGPSRCPARAGSGPPAASLLPLGRVGPGWRQYKGSLLPEPDRSRY
jgi:hypothetical protein